MPGNINPDFIHGFDGSGIEPDRMGAGTERFVAIPRQMSQPPFGHLAPCGIAGTEKQDATLDDPALHKDAVVITDLQRDR